MKLTPDFIQIEKYRKTRFWAVWINQELLAVVCYKKGALAIKQILLRLIQHQKKIVIVFQSNVGFKGSGALCPFSECTITGWIDESPSQYFLISPE
jgi:hypothetical protein